MIVYCGESKDVSIKRSFMTDMLRAAVFIIALWSVAIWLSCK